VSGGAFSLGRLTGWIPVLADAIAGVGLYSFELIGCVLFRWFLRIWRASSAERTGGEVFDFVEFSSVLGLGLT